MSHRIDHPSADAASTRRAVPTSPTTSRPNPATPATPEATARTRAPLVGAILAGIRSLLARRAVLVLGGLALVVIVGTEFLAADKGIGFMIWQSYQTLRIQQMFVGLVITGIMGWGLSLLLDLVEYVVVPWRSAHREA